MRKAPTITMDEFKEKIGYLFIPTEHSDGEIRFPYNLPKSIEIDLSKVRFDFENFAVGEADPDYKPIYDSAYTWGGLCGFKTLKNGLNILMCGAGGDWEEPIYFIFYWDGKSIRAYIPKKGNTWHPKYKAAFGSWEVNDEPDENPYKYDFEKMENDIISRIQIK